MHYRIHIRLLLVLSLANFGQAAAQSTFVPERTATEGAPATSLKLVLEDGTPVKLRTGRTVSSADAHVGDLVDFGATQHEQRGGYPVIGRCIAACGRFVS